MVLALLSWLRGVGSATGPSFLEPFIVASMPAFLWLGAYGLRLGRQARGQGTFSGRSSANESASARDVWTRTT